MREGNKEGFDIIIVLSLNRAVRSRSKGALFSDSTQYTLRVHSSGNIQRVIPSGPHFVTVCCLLLFFCQHCSLSHKVYKLVGAEMSVRVENNAKGKNVVNTVVVCV